MCPHHVLQGAPDIAVGHHMFLNNIVLVEINERRRRSGKPTFAVAPFVHGTALKMYQKEIESGKERCVPKPRLR